MSSRPNRVNGNSSCSDPYLKDGLGDVETNGGDRAHALRLCRWLPKEACYLTTGWEPSTALLRDVPGPAPNFAYALGSYLAK